jgi:hypothetical protein
MAYGLLHHARGQVTNHSKPFSQPSLAKCTYIKYEKLTFGLKLKFDILPKLQLLLKFSLPYLLLDQHSHLMGTHFDCHEHLPTVTYSETWLILNSVIQNFTIM